MKADQARVVLTGASGGIGRAVAAKLLHAGAAVMLVGRSAGRLAGQVRELTAELGINPDGESRIAWRVADLTLPMALAQLARDVAEWRGNVLVHGAGVPAFGPVCELDADRLTTLVETNLVAPIRLTQALLPYLRSLPHAQIICVGSALGRIGLPGFAAYSATKFGLHGFAEALRRELGGTNVRVQYLGPRSTRTGFNDARVDAYNKATGTAMDTPEHVARALLALLENERAERYIGFPEVIAVRLNALAGSWLDGAFRKHRQSLQSPN